MSCGLPAFNAFCFSDSRILFVSNSTESIQSGTGPNLYKAEISIPTGASQFRFWIWHQNSTGSDIYLQLVASLTSGTGTVSDIKVAALSGTNLVALGQCLAQAQLNASFDSFPSNISLGTTELSVWGGGPIADGPVIGVLIEATVTVSAASTLRVRSYWSAGTGIGAWSNAMDASTDGHIRGVWQSCKAEIPCSSLDATPNVYPDPPHILKISVCEDDGEEEQLFAQPDNDSTENKGCYGVDLVYSIPITNSGNQPYPVYLYAQGRGLGETNIGSYGAAKTSPNTTSGYMTLPVLKYDANIQLDKMCGICVNSNGNPTTFDCPVGGMILLVTIANGGGATLPFNLVLTNGLSIMPVEPPGG